MTQGAQESPARNPVDDAVLRCPRCRAPWRGERVATTCPGCGRETPILDGVAVLVDDLQGIEAQIEEARRSSREPWYSDPQDVVLTGPYRHHVAKRIGYVEDALRRFAPRAPSERLLLDVGCGDGTHHPWLARHAAVLHGSDYNLLRLRRAASRGLASALFLADVTDYPAVDAAYDVVFCNHVLEHVPDDVRALRELGRVLRPDGVLVLGVPNEGAAFWRLAYSLQPESRTATDHVHFYTAESVAARASAAGLEVREVQPIGWGLPHWGLDARVRGSRRVDDVFAALGRRLLPGQATSLYLMLGRGSN